MGEVSFQATFTNQFKVEVLDPQGVSLQQLFVQEITPPETSIETQDIGSFAGDNNRKVSSGKENIENFTFRRYHSAAQTDNFEQSWYDSVKSKPYEEYIGTVRISALSPQGAVTKVWLLEESYPVRITPDTFIRTGTEIHFTEVELVCNKLTVTTL